MKVECRNCGIKKEVQDTKDWEMQHLHFAETEIEFLTCEKCKLLSPMVYLTKLSEREINPHETQQ